MAFDDIRWTGLMLLIPIYWICAAYSFKKSQSWRYAFSRRIKPWGPFLYAEILFSCAMIFGALSLSGPKLPYEKTVFNRSGIEIVLGMDVSKSMLAEDADLPEQGQGLFPVQNRLNRARYFALNFLSGLHGERAGAFMFSGNGVEIFPITADYGYGRYVLKHIYPGDITVPGSDLGAAIRTGVSMFENTGSHALKRMVLLSDGEDISPDRSTLYESAKLAAGKGIRIYTVGIGMDKGVLIPMRDRNGEIQDYYTADDGTPLKTRLEPEPLKAIAEITGGTYVRDSDTAYQEIMEVILRDSQGFSQTQTLETAWMDLSPWMLLMAFCFLASTQVAGWLMEKRKNTTWMWM